MNNVKRSKKAGIITALLFASLFLSTFFSLNAQSQTPKVPASDINIPKLYDFLIDRTLLMRDFGKNSQLLDALDLILGESSVYENIDSIFITGAASPIGKRSRNDRLSYERAEALKRYILKRHPHMNPSRISTSVMGIDWEGFRTLVATDHNIPSRGKIQELLALNLPEERLLERLRTVGGRETFDYLVKNIYPQLQYATFRIRLNSGEEIPFYTGSPLKAYVEQTTQNAPLTIINNNIYLSDTSPSQPEEEPAAPKKGYYFGVKTNLLYDAALLPNLSLEFPFAGSWSVVLEGNWSWWTFGSLPNSYHRIQAAGLEVRRWLGSPALTGHAIGLYGLYGTYDIRLFPKDNDSKGWLSNGSYSCGLSYAYSIPLAKRFHLELGLAAGYAAGRYYDYKYHINEEHERWEWTAIRNRHYWGLTRAEISLVWIIGRKNNTLNNLEKKGNNQ